MKQVRDHCQWLHCMTIQNATENLQATKHVQQDCLQQMLLQAV